MANLVDNISSFGFKTGSFDTMSETEEYKNKIISNINDSGILEANLDIAIDSNLKSMIEDNLGNLINDLGLDGMFDVSSLSNIVEDVQKAITDSLGPIGLPAEIKKYFRDAVEVICSGKFNINIDPVFVSFTIMGLLKALNCMKTDMPITDMSKILKDKLLENPLNVLSLAQLSPERLEEYNINREIYNASKLEHDLKVDILMSSAMKPYLDSMETMSTSTIKDLSNNLHLIGISSKHSKSLESSLIKSLSKVRPKKRDTSSTYEEMKTLLSATSSSESVHIKALENEDYNKIAKQAILSKQPSLTVISEPSLEAIL